MGVDNAGKLVAYRYHGTSPSISSRLFPSIVKDASIRSRSSHRQLPVCGPEPQADVHDARHGHHPGYWRGVSHN